uniref:Tail specific protease domain-containing protein n=1 Tax=Thermosporothrix sp. COM3 TaxID=2490863 RepID=A0A455STB6_9CHLR|nr:hypothetical protein KTC_63580 [Thermosporothrix sp. COM3]
MPGELVFTGPLFVLTGGETSAQLEPVLILLQQTGRAYCLGEQSQPYRAEEHLLSLTNEWKVRLRQHILFYHDHPIRYTPDIVTNEPLQEVLLLLAGKKQERSMQETSARQATQDIEEERLPARASRMLAVIKLWTAMCSFYAYPDHLEHWDEALVPALEEVAAVRTRETYFMTLQRLASRCRGGHNFVLFWRDGQIQRAIFPYGAVPGIRLARVKGRITVMGPLPAEIPLYPGEVLEAVDDEPVQQRETRLIALVMQYPVQARDHYLLCALLDSPKGAVVRLRVRDQQGHTREVEVVADYPTSFVTEPVAVTTLPPWGMLSDEWAEIGYLDASRVQIEQAFVDLKMAKALIIDVRRYPTLTVAALTRFQREPVPFLPMLRPMVSAPERGVFGWLENRVMDEDVFLPVEEPDPRPLAVLIGGGTVSMGEDWTYRLLQGCGALLVGEETAGGVGSNAFVNLPGGGLHFPGPMRSF